MKSVVMLMFREEKSPEDEIKAWQFWHGRQHSVKQRILDAAANNSIVSSSVLSSELKQDLLENVIIIKLHWSRPERNNTEFGSEKRDHGLA
uniref:Grh/CP2 DB domain-containing protein n=1 Tax=Timema douglasi TaxID=61478 RepID=A0A7R8VGF2_TIMDO|nr:unnamed protein product [Timema douglasi]